MENEARKGTEAHIRNINELFRRPVSYLIPQFQRPYAWKRDEQWVPLMEDVQAVAKRYMKPEGVGKVRPHFLGAIVLQHREPGLVDKIVVVDGQQRLTTLQLLIKAAHQVFQQMDDVERAARLRELTENPDHLVENDEHWTKIRQSNSNDKRAFRDIIESVFREEQGNQSSITDSFSYFKENVEKWLDDEGDNILARADALEKALTEYIQIAVIDLDRDEKPHVIFETLNARGEALRQSDLVKNVVMYEADVIDDHRKASDLWGMFDGDQWWRKNTDEPQLKRIESDRFLNHWMIMETRKSVGPDRVSSEFRTYVENHRTTLDIHAIAQKIRVSGRTYKEIMEGREKLLGSLFLERMRAIGIMGSIIPLLLWLRKSDMPSNRLDRCVQVLESYVVRRMIYGLGSQGLSRFFIGLLEDLHKESSQHYDLIMARRLSSVSADNLIWPNNRMLLERVKERPMAGTVARRKMVLEARERELRADMAEPVDLTKSTIEHIMPQKWEPHWPLPAENPSQEDRDQRDWYVKYLGNLTLTTSKLNTSISNGPWSEKQERLREYSSLLINKEILDPALSDWNEDTIRKRTDRLAQKIVEIWKPAEYFIETSDLLGHS